MMHLPSTWIGVNFKPSRTVYVCSLGLSDLSENFPCQEHIELQVKVHVHVHCVIVHVGLLA